MWGTSQQRLLLVRTVPLVTDVSGFLAMSDTSATHCQASAGSPRNADLKKELANNLHNSMGTVRCASFWKCSPSSRLSHGC